MLNNFFTVKDLRPEAGAAYATLLLNAGHPIFEGHFPGRPVVPGVCLLQSVQELLIRVMGFELRLIRADQVKFIQPVDPVADPVIEMTLRWKEAPGGGWIVSGEGFNGGAACFRFKGSFLAGSGYAG